MKPLLAVCALALVMAGCGSVAPTAEKVKEAASNIRYGKDPKTGLCFAFMDNNTYSAYTVTTFTLVPEVACK